MFPRSQILFSNAKRFFLCTVCKPNFTQMNGNNSAIREWLEILNEQASFFGFTLTDWKDLKETRVTCNPVHFTLSGNHTGVSSSAVADWLAITDFQRLAISVTMTSYQSCAVICYNGNWHRTDWEGRERRGERDWFLVWINCIKIRHWPVHWGMLAETRYRVNLKSISRVLAIQIWFSIIIISLQK